MTGGGSPERVVLVSLLVLTFTTGIVDAVGFLGLDRVFAGNMTGNVVILGMGAVGADDLPVAGPAVALAAFALGAVVAGAALRGAVVGRWGRRCTALSSAVVVLLALVTVAFAVVPTPGPEHLWGHAVTAGLAAAMGLQAATARHVAVKDVTTVVVTSTVTGLAADSWLGARLPQPWRRRLAAVVSIAAGAATGAALLALHPAWGTGAAAALTLVVTVVVPLTGRRDRDDDAARPDAVRAAADAS